MDHVAGHDGVIVAAAQIDHHVADGVAGAGTKRSAPERSSNRQMVGLDELGLSGRNHRAAPNPANEP